jgi:hypothetical protein
MLAGGSKSDSTGNKNQLWISVQTYNTIRAGPSKAPNVYLVEDLTQVEGLA